MKGPLRVTDMVCWHVGMGMGLYGVKALRLGYDQRQRVPAVLPARRPQHPRRAAARALGRRVGAQGRQPRDLRLRPHARDVAHPPLHRLDGRRRLAVEARLRVPAVQLRRRHALDARPGDPQVYLADGDRPAVELDVWGENQRGEDDDPGPRDDPAAEPRARRGAASPTRPAARRPVRPRSTRSSTGSRAWSEREALPDGAGRPGGRATTGRCCACGSTGPSGATRSPTTSSLALIETIDAAGSDEAVRVIALSGTGEHFCSGFDLGERARAGPTKPRTGSTQRQHALARQPPDPDDARDADADRGRGDGLRHRARSEPRARLRLRRRRATTPACARRSPAWASPPDSGASWLLPGWSAWPGPRRC